MTVIGQLGEPYLNDLLLELHIESSSTDLRLTRRGEHGLIALRGGELVHATIETDHALTATTTVGPAAVYRMLSWSSGSYQIIRPNDPIEQSIMSPLKDVLLEGSRRFYDGAEIRRRLPPADTILEIVKAPVGVINIPLSPVELTVLSEIDGRRTLGELLEQSTLGIALCGQAILRLLSIDLVRAHHGRLVRQLLDRDPRTVFPVRQPLWRRMLSLLNPLLETPNAGDPLIAQVLQTCTGRLSLTEIGSRLQFSESQILSAVDQLIASRVVSLTIRERDRI